MLDFSLPDELIASRPTAEREEARLLLVDRTQPPGEVGHSTICKLDEHIPPGALVIVNDTRVVAARLLGRKLATGGQVELLLLRKLKSSEGGLVEHWLARGRASKPIRQGAELAFGENGEIKAHVVQCAGDAMLEVVLSSPRGVAVEKLIGIHGHIPLPPYMKRADDASDRERYQTVFARTPGAIAAPTAGLHFSNQLVEKLQSRGVKMTSITLHVGLGTFKPVTALDLDDHPMHEEEYFVSDEVSEAIDDARRRKVPVIAVGTTVVRALETAADPSRPGRVTASSGETRVLIQPGYRFRVVDALITNFHLPQSTLLALVCAFAGGRRTLAAYRAAITSSYRFYSYGDAMMVFG
ncbi:tRNA preQ1(34) S-adenosylmethionine ribosyltransferase-isomerase QueA [Chondromyces crocatus]|uniref:S-adenosylmethionine:tRNA ribosyltransferase-isomerase n=1 Tax=Chondromyces crocatus TaxID=52 RepID=A0A0K1EN91_CHOCO|nr:tRNA preQ1(34) S-adenosylmethionine ribosyltransferase-isomerase QueA [Chondromyces crocatus]AKT42324.1 S-adenosylmethionine tRNA ribosyltransferase [Chondromyces crocatus]